MVPGIDMSKWWAKEERKGTPVIVKMENPNYSLLEIESPDSAFRAVDKDRGKNAKQLTWVILLRAHKAAGCVAWLGNGVWSLLSTIKKRLILGEGVKMENDKSGKGKLLYRIILGFLITALAFLAFELFAHFNGWHYYLQSTSLQHMIPRTIEIQGLLHEVYVGWVNFRVGYIAPLIQSLSTFCVVLFMIQSLDRLVLCFGCFWIKMKKIKPQFKAEPFKSDDAENPGSFHPMVLVQIPMCNEREVHSLTFS